jgi:hypothetical protein
MIMTDSVDRWHYGFVGILQHNEGTSMDMNLRNHLGGGGTSGWNKAVTREPNDTTRA